MVPESGCGVTRRRRSTDDGGSRCRWHRRFKACQSATPILQHRPIPGPVEAVSVGEVGACQDVQWTVGQRRSVDGEDGHAGAAPVLLAGLRGRCPPPPIPLQRAALLWLRHGGGRAQASIRAELPPPATSPPSSGRQREKIGRAHV